MSFFGRKPRPKSSLRDFSDIELYQFLQKNDTADLGELSGICSEVLRRMLEKDYKNESVEE